MSIPCLGIDPGKWSGAAVLLDPNGTTVQRWWVWTRLKRMGEEVYRIKASWYGGRRLTMGEVGAYIRDWCEPEEPEIQVCCEGLFVWRVVG